MKTLFRCFKNLSSKNIYLYRFRIVAERVKKKQGKGNGKKDEIRDPDVVTSTQRRVGVVGVG